MVLCLYSVMIKNLLKIFSKTPVEKNQLAIYWGKDSVSLAETLKDLPDNIATIRLDSPIPGDQGQKIPDNLRLTALIQQAIRDKKFISKKANLALSTKDVIYRSFVIPFMQPGEVKNVIDFEATKYIPIKLDDLSYTFHAIPFSEGEQKNLRILFVAARKNVLERYSHILQQAGLETDFVEPASVSLARLLQKQGHIPRQQSTGIIEVEHEGGRVSVIEKEIIQFVREFQSTVEGNGDPAENSKFFNDIRVSFTFYQRQNPQGKVDRIILISEKELGALAAGITQEFKVPCLSLTIPKILKKAASDDLGVLCAGGASIRERIFSSKNFDLTLKSRTGKTGLEDSGPLAGWDLKFLGICLALSAGLIFLTNVISHNIIDATIKKADGLKQKLGFYETSTKDSLVTLRDDALKKLNQYKDVRIKSDLSYFVKKVPKLLLKGAWLSNFSIEYFAPGGNAGNSRNSSHIALSLDGLVYLPNPNDQIRQVNNMVQAMKEDKEFAEHFDNIILNDSRSEIYNNYPVKSFRINCK